MELAVFLRVILVLKSTIMAVKNILIAYPVVKPLQLQLIFKIKKK